MIVMMVVVMIGSFLLSDSDGIGRSGAFLCIHSQLDRRVRSMYIITSIIIGTHLELILESRHVFTGDNLVHLVDPSPEVAGRYIGLSTCDELV